MPRTKGVDKRVIVLFGKNKEGRAVYVRPLKSVADFFGLPIEKKIPFRKGKKNRIIYQRGSLGTASIKVPSGKLTKSKAQQFFSIPIPASATIGKIEAFLKKAKKNKPVSFVTQFGQEYPIGK